MNQATRHVLVVSNLLSIIDTCITTLSSAGLEYLPRAMTHSERERERERERECVCVCV